jgi:hypothetical protein
MREIRLSGSEGGAGFNPRSLPLSRFLGGEQSESLPQHLLPIARGTGKIPPPAPPPLTPYSGSLANTGGWAGQKPWTWCVVAFIS